MKRAVRQTLVGLLALSGVGAAAHLSGCSSDSDGIPVTPDAGEAVQPQDSGMQQADAAPRGDGGSLLGDASRPDASSTSDGGDGGTVQIPDGGSFVRDVSMLGGNVCAIVDTPVSAGRIECWGSSLGYDSSFLSPDVPSGSLQLYGVEDDPRRVMTPPNGSDTASASSPVHLRAPHTPTSIRLGINHLCTLEGSGGAVRCWGDKHLRGDGTKAGLQAWPANPALASASLLLTSANVTYAVGPAGQALSWGVDPNVGTAYPPTPVSIPMFQELGIFRDLSDNILALVFRESADAPSAYWAAVYPGSVQVRVPFEMRGLPTGSDQFFCAVATDGQVRCRKVDPDTGFLGGWLVVPDVSDALAVSVVWTGAACALQSSGRITCWGDNTYGQCGVPKGGPGSVTVKTPEGDTITQEPVQIAGVENAAQLESGAYADTDQGFCARTSGGALYCWGQGARCGVGAKGVCLPSRVTAWQ